MDASVDRTVRLEVGPRYKKPWSRTSDGELAARRREGDFAWNKRSNSTLHVHVVSPTGNSKISKVQARTLDADCPTGW